MTHELDVRGLLCPIPVIRTQNHIRSLNQGDELRVLGTDPGILNDIPAWARINGHEVLACEQDDKEVIVNLRVGEQEDLLF